jgi:nucleotide-binding universal stress UspA family protein
MSNDKNLTIRRILVALDASTHSLAALAAAAELAASMHAELLGLYVEDENLVHLAALPFASEVRSHSAVSKPVNSNEMEAALRLQASQARRALEAAATKANAKWSFQVVRGQVTASILAAALEADLLAMGRISRPLSSRTRLGSSARAVMSGSGRSVLIMEQGSHLHYPVLATFDGSAAARQALTAAAQLAQSSGVNLNVLILGNAEERADLEIAAADLLAESGMQAQYFWMNDVSVSGLTDMVNSAEDCVLVLGGENKLLKAENIQDLLDRTDCPVMLVR